MNSKLFFGFLCTMAYCAMLGKARTLSANNEKNDDIVVAANDERLGDVEATVQVTQYKMEAAKDDKDDEELEEDEDDSSSSSSEEVEDDDNDDDDEEHDENDESHHHNGNELDTLDGEGDHSHHHHHTHKKHVGPNAQLTDAELKAHPTKYHVHASHDSDSSSLDSLASKILVALEKSIHVTHTGDGNGSITNIVVAIADNGGQVTLNLNDTSASTTSGDSAVKVAVLASNRHKPKCQCRRCRKMMKKSGATLTAAHSLEMLDTGDDNGDENGDEKIASHVQNQEVVHKVNHVVDAGSTKTITTKEDAVDDVVSVATITTTTTDGKPQVEVLETTTSSSIIDDDIADAEQAIEMVKIAPEVKDDDEMTIVNEEVDTKDTEEGNEDIENIEEEMAPTTKEATMPYTSNLAPSVDVVKIEGEELAEN